jgi:hypothetical protein
MSHFTFAGVVELPQRSSELTLEDLRQRGAKDLRASDVVVEFSRDIVQELECPQCGGKEARFAPVGSIKYEQGRCPNDGQMRVVKTIHSYSGNESFGGQTLDKIGLPLYDVFSVRSAEAEKAYLIAGDQAAVLGEELSH